MTNRTEKSLMFDGLINKFAASFSFRFIFYALNEFETTFHFEFSFRIFSQLVGFNVEKQFYNIDCSDWKYR